MDCQTNNTEHADNLPNVQAAQAEVETQQSKIYN